MKIYQVSSVGNENSVVNSEHQGYQYFDTKREAKNLIANSPNYDCEIRVLNLPVNKQGLLRALNIYASHPDNG